MGARPPRRRGGGPGDGNSRETIASPQAERPAIKAERRRLAPEARNETAFAAEEERLFSAALDIEASAETIYARAEGPPYVVPRPKEDDSEQRAASI
jgi:hypothetical protein